MFVTCLNEQQKDDVVDRFVNHEESQSDIARAYVLSRRTIQRVLQERGILSSKVEKRECTVNDVALLSIVKKHNIDEPQTLDRALSSPVLTHTNALIYMCNLDEYAFSNAMKAVQRARAKIYNESKNA